MSLKDFKTWHDRESAPSFSKRYDAEVNAWIYMVWNDSTRGDDPWVQCSKRDYELGMLEFHRTNRIKAEGVPRFQTPEEAEEWLNAQSK